ncbi:tyrosine-type recombinase/integrase [Undibacterium jejuense]|uniref:Tyrosine-type recombinase/integrase n=1 Tax=Undibacterium jejuense TaxID=1344949 RepID=A0A923HEK3_9BURK|nr:site-specific integrase [Undibacterium jejuense]MBC3860943.1 tyrosine-type recombinase/integrase [Undibacterium jejuense]
MADLTVMQIEKLKPSSEYQKIRVSKGLFIGVSTNGEKTFFVRYTVKCKQRDFRISKTFGRSSSESSISLVDAKAKAAEIQALAKDGIDYQEKQILEAELAIARKDENLTVYDLYQAWFATLNRKDGGESIDRNFKKSVLPAIGSKRLKDIVESDVKTVLQDISKDGKNRTAEMLLSLLKQMFKWGNGRKPYKTHLDNPVLNLRKSDATQKGYKTVERDRYLSDLEIIELSQKIPDAGLIKSTQTLIWLCLSCCTRVGETLMARWEDIDLINRVWHIPEANTKGRAGNHKIYLSDFSFRQFEALKVNQESAIWCFPNKENTSHVCLKSATKQIGDRQLNSKGRAILVGRSKLRDSLELSGGAWTPHDLRRTGATLMQSLDVDQHIIERVLNHTEQNRMMRTYQQYDYSPKLKDAWGKLGSHFDNLLTSLKT